MRDFIRTALTAADNQTYDIGRALLALLVLCFVAFSGFALMWLHQEWNPVAWSGAAGSLLLCGGGALLIKHPTEPKP